MKLLGATRLLVLFVDEVDAQQFAQTLPKRLAKFALEVAPEKTQLIPFGSKFWRSGPGSTGTFDFLGLTHILGTTARAQMAVVRIPSRKSVHRFLMEVKAWLRQHMHWPPVQQQKVLAAKVTGFYQYFGLRHCTAKLGLIRHQLFGYWRKALGRRSQRGRLAWAWLRQRPWFTLPTPRVLHPLV